METSFNMFYPKCRELADALELGLDDREIAIATLYVVLASYGERGNPFLFNFKLTFKTFPFEAFDDLIPAHAEACGEIDVLFPEIQAAFEEIYKNEAWLRHLREDEFFSGRLGRSGEEANILYRYFVGNDRYTELFRSFNWDFQSGRPYYPVPDMNGSEGGTPDILRFGLAQRTYLILDRKGLNHISHETICRTILSPLAPDTDGVCCFIPLNEGQIPIRVKVPDALLEDLRNRLVPDLVLADSRYLMFRFDWNNRREVRIITANGENKQLPKLTKKGGKSFETWLDGYFKAQRKPLWKFLVGANESKRGKVKKILKRFEAEGYIRTIKAGQQYEWLRKEKELVCLIYELWYGFNDAERIPWKDLIAYIDTKKGVKKDTLKVLKNQYVGSLSIGENKENWGDEQRYLEFKKNRQRENDDYVRILDLIREVVNSEKK